jgi:hypothetical protein
MTKRISMGLGLLLIGVLAGAGGVHAVQVFQRTSFLNTGLFTVDPGEGVSFRVTLDDGRTGPPATVLLRLLDQNGAVVARRDAQLAPGQSAALDFRRPGVFRAQAQVIEPGGALGTRRILVGTVEISTLYSTAGDATALSLDPGGERRFVCSHDDGGGNGRIPDFE